MDTIKVTEESELSVGDEIAYGVRVVAQTKNCDLMVGSAYVLYASWVTICAVDHDPIANYVVWTVTATENDGWSRESGTYCTSIIEAVADYVSRGGK
jgi:hypothetical protein